MASLEEFEKQLSQEKAAREREDKRRNRKHRHDLDDSKHSRRARSRDRNHRHSKDHRDRSRDRRQRRHSEDSDDGSNAHKHKRRRTGSSTREDHEQQPCEDEQNRGKKLIRDSWMTAPFSLDVDYIQRTAKNPARPPSRPEKRKVYEMEINADLETFNARDTRAEPDDKAAQQQHEVDYTFGDEGSKWRMVKLKAVFATAKDTGTPVEQVALERFGSLQVFDNYREEQIELDRRKTYGKGYVAKQKPDGELHRQRLEKDAQRQHERSRQIEEERKLVDHAPAPPFDTPVPLNQNSLNKLKAQLMRARLRKDPNLAKLEAEYEATVANQSTAPQDIILSAMNCRQLAGERGEVKAVTTRRGLERGKVEANEDMTIDDMVREERRTRGQQGGEGLRLAERIAKDSRFDNNLEYMDENAEKLAKRVHKSEAGLRNVAISEYQKHARALDSCPLCRHEEDDDDDKSRDVSKDSSSRAITPVVSLGTRTYLTLPPEPELSDGSAVITPLAHHRNLLECDDDEWEEIRNFMKALTRLYHSRDQDVVFYENAARPQRHEHATMVAVPLPRGLGATAPAFFREAMVTQDEEWAQHAKLIDTAQRARVDGLGRGQAFRRSIAKEMPYFHVWFSLDGGLGHIVEDHDKWPRGDLFAREVIGGILDLGPEIVRKQGKWRRHEAEKVKKRVERFRRTWHEFDWTRVLVETGAS